MNGLLSKSKRFIVFFITKPKEYLEFDFLFHNFAIYNLILIFIFPEVYEEILLADDSYYRFFNVGTNTKAKRSDN